MALYRDPVAARYERAAEIAANIEAARQELVVLHREAADLGARWDETIRWIAAPTPSSRFRLGVGLGLVMGFVMPGARAEDASATAQPQAAPAAAPATPPAPAPAPEKPTTKEDAVRSQLDGTKWALAMTPMSGGDKAKGKEDTVTFGQKEVVSERLSKGGYLNSNYTLTINGDTPVWETMQSKEKEGVVFWRGELHGSSMRGIVSEHPANGKTVDFSFTGNEVSGKAITLDGQAPPPPSVPAPQADAVAAPAPDTSVAPPAPAAPAQAAPAPQAQPQPKKRKGWF